MLQLITKSFHHTPTVTPMFAFVDYVVIVLL